MPEHNLKQFGIALHAFHDANDRFPAAHNINPATYPTYQVDPPPGGINPVTNYPNDGVFFSWTYHVAPYIEQENAYKLFDRTKSPWWQYLPGLPPTPANTINGIPIKIAQCPSDSRSALICTYTGGYQAALTSYLGVNGRNQFKESAGQDGILYVNAGVRMVAITDGTSNTLLVGERPPSNNLYYGWMWAGSGDSPYHGSTDVVLGVRERVTPTADPEFFRPGELNDPQDLHRYHFWSLHTGGGNWLLADGSVRFIGYSAGTATVSPAVTLLEAMASRAGGEVFSDQ